MSGWSFTICFLLLSVGSSLQACSDYYDCVDCVNGGCGWCDNTEACLSLSSSSSCTNSSQCFKSSTAFGAKCSSVSCSSLTNCYSCVNSGCGWCDTSHSCVPIHNDGTEPCGSNCPNNTQCFKNSIAFGAKCPTADCSSNTNCYTCVQKGCGWCDITSQCLPTYNDGSQPCVGNCTDQCYKNSIAYGAKCASVSCSSYTDCNSCVIGGCGWCDITHKCLPTFNDATAPCIENCTDQCYKISTAYGAKCPTTNCSSFLNCSTCVDRGCGWCDITGTCLPTYNNGSQPCIGNCTDQCYKRSTAFGAKCPTKSCANYTNCNACAIGGCGWCDSTQQCLPVFNNGSGPCQENCPENDQCWKTSTAFGAACASQSCSLYKNCYSCASSGCGWCSASQTCLPRTNNNTAFCMGDCTNSSTCFKTSTSFSSMCETYSCNAFNSCVSCMNKDSCTWCASQGICVEQGYGDTLCSNCTDPVPAGQCPDCESYGCKNNATCMSSGFCNCSENYFGYYCEQYCYAPTTCSNKGICTDSGTCNCDMYYYGANCSIYCNANTTCQGRGFCYGGTCTCNAPYYGPTCDTYCDPSVTCSSNGYCTYQGCQCYYSYYGQDCSTHCDPITTCNGNGVCDSNGKCQCTTGSGSDCASSKSLSGGAIAGIFFSVLIPAIIAAFCCYKKLKRTPYYDPPTSNQSFNNNNNNNYTAQATLTRLTPDMSEFTSVKQVFYDKWTKGDPEKIKILGILTVNNSNIHTKYKSYQSRMSSHSSNVQQVFHGTKLSASCMLHSASTLCRHSDCAICCITNEGFKLSKSGTNITFARFGRGIYFAPNSSKANDYNEAAVRAMLVCDVLAGNEYHSEDNMQTLTAPPTGYHSVRGIVGTKLNYPELVVYDEDAILVTNIILYSVSS